MSGRTIAEMTAEARRSLAAARVAAGEPWQDDSDKDIHQIARECVAIRDRVIAREAYADWKRKHRLTWRWRTYDPAG